MTIITNETHCVRGVVICGFFCSLEPGENWTTWSSGVFMSLTLFIIFMF